METVEIIEAIFYLSIWLAFTAWLWTYPERRR